MVGSDGKRVIPFQDIGNEVLKTMLEHDSLSFMLDGKPRSMITWHPFPKEQPPEDGRYLVTFRLPDGREGTGMVDVRAGQLRSDIITHWAEIPVLYKEVTSCHG